MTKDDVTWQMKHNDGMIFYQGVRVGIIDFKIFTVIFRELDRLIGPVAGTLIYQAVKKHTLENTKTILSNLGFKDVTKNQPFDAKSIPKIIELGITELMSRFGLGVIEVVEIDIEKMIIRFSVKNSIIADSYEDKKEYPVCHFIAGMIAGGAEVVLSHNLDCKEVKCKACGDEICEFIIQKNFE